MRSYAPNASFIGASRSLPDLNHPDRTFAPQKLRQNLAWPSPNHHKMRAGETYGLASSIQRKILVAVLLHRKAHSRHVIGQIWVRRIRHRGRIRYCHFDLPQQIHHLFRCVTPRCNMLSLFSLSLTQWYSSSRPLHSLPSTLESTSYSPPPLMDPPTSTKQGSSMSTGGAGMPYRWELRLHAPSLVRNPNE
jgi:hypothetical protein